MVTGSPPPTRERSPSTMREADAHPIRADQSEERARSGGSPHLGTLSGTVGRSSTHHQHLITMMRGRTRAPLLPQSTITTR